jgi:dTDP-4-dehydrorhamnose 3,5-epimerase-like enzyme
MGQKVTTENAMKFHMDNRTQRVIDIFDLDDVQINISIVNSTEHIVAWHYHKLQRDFFYCIKGSFQVGLAIDKPPDEKQWFTYLSDKDPCKYIEIPPLTYHGYRALEPESIMLYYLTKKYNPSDEYRVDVGYFGESWDIPNK